MKNEQSFLKFIAPLASEEWILLIKNYLEIQSLKKGSRIFNEGDSVTGIYFINLGKIKVISHYDTKNERILRLSHDGHMLGHRSFHLSKFNISAVALTDVEVTFIPKDIFIKFIKGNPNFALYLLEFMSKDLSESEERMKCMIHHEVIVRVCKIICMLIEAYGYDSKNPHKLAYTLPRDDIANLVGTTYESVIRNLGKLDELKLIQLDNKSIIVPDENAIRKFIAKATIKSL